MSRAGADRSLLADRMSVVKDSPTAAVSALVRERRAAGDNVINLGEGELDFDTPEHVCEAGVRAIRAGDTRYTAVGGTEELKTAIIAKFRREDGLDYAANEVIAATGAKQIIFNAMLATVQDGDEVAIPTPSWVSYPDIVRVAGGTPKDIPCPASQGFKLRPDQLDRSLTPNVKWLILNSPNNPSGAVLAKDELAALADVLRRHPRVMVLSDDIYQHITYRGPASTLAAVAPDLKGRVLTVNGVSKTHSMTGWRLGFAGGPDWLVKAIATLQSQSTSNPCSVTQAAAACGLNEPIAFFRPRLQALEGRRDRTVAALNETHGMLAAEAPDGAFYVYAGCAAMIGRRTADGKDLRTDSDVAAYLVDAAGVATVPGAAFAMSPYLRIAYGVSDEALDLALARLVEACSALTRV